MSDPAWMRRRGGSNWLCIPTWLYRITVRFELMGAVEMESAQFDQRLCRLRLKRTCPLERLTCRIKASQLLPALAEFQPCFEKCGIMSGRLFKLVDGFVDVALLLFVQAILVFLDSFRRILLEQIGGDHPRRSLRFNFIAGIAGRFCFGVVIG